MPWYWPFTTETKAEGYDVSSSVPVGFGANHWQSQEIDAENYARQSYNTDAIVYACIRALATAATEPQYRALVPTSSEPALAPPNNPIASLLVHPNEDTTFDEFVEQLVTELYIAGNVYLYKIRNPGGTMIGMRLLRPDRISILSDPRSGVMKYNYTLEGKQYQVDASDISHMKFPSMTSDLYGHSPLQSIASVINLDQAQIQFGKSAFQNMGVVGGLLKLNRRISNEDQAEDIRRRWRSTFGGGNMFNLGILDQDADYQRISSTPEELSFPSLRDTTEARICMAFGVPPIIIGSVVGLDRATYSNYKEARNSFFQQTVTPLCERITMFLSNCLSYEFPNAGYIDADFQSVAAMTEDQTKLSDRIISQWNAGLISLNEARAALSLDGYQGGDLRRLPLNVLETSTSQVSPTLPTVNNTLQIEASDRKKLESQLDPDSPYDPLPGQPRARLLNQDLVAARIEHAEKLVPKLEKFYRGMKNRIDGVLGRYLQQQISEQKTYPFDDGDLVPEQAFNELAGILRSSHAGMIRATFNILNDGAGIGNLIYSEKLPIVPTLLGEANISANQIVSTSRKAIAKAVSFGLENGLSVQELADGIPDEGFRGIRSIAAETYKNQAQTIARTEMARSQNQATIGYAQSLGSVYSEAYDPDGDPNDTYVDPNDPYGRTCAERHLQTYRNIDAQNILDHPNGTLTWTPLPSTYKPREEFAESIIEHKETIDAGV